MNICLPNDFTPRDYQTGFMRYLDSGGKRAVWIVHRRGGKDLTAIHQTCKMAHTRKGVYWHIFPTFSQARKAIWEGFRKDGKRILENTFPGFLNPRGPGSIVKKKDDQQMSLELKCGSIWRLLGSDNVEVVGAGPVGVVFSEFALSKPQGWRLISPMLRENGGWAAFITTPRGKNHAYEIYNEAANNPAWFRQLLTVHDTGLTFESTSKPGVQVGPREMMEEERTSGMPEAIIRQEYECDWNAALVGSVYGDLMEKLHASGAVGQTFDPSGQVYTAWDLGHADETAIWFYYVDETGCDLIDYYEARGQALDHYFEVVEARGYNCARHYLPHDSGQTTLASGVSVRNLMMKRWPGKIEVVPRLPIMEGILAARWLLGRSVRFHKKCSVGVDALQQYHFEYDTERKVLSSRPVHDWSSNGADAFRILATAVKRSESLAPRKVETRTQVNHKAVAKFTLDQLFKSRESDMGRRRRIR